MCNERNILIFFTLGSATEIRNAAIDRMHKQAIADLKVIPTTV